MWLSSVYRNYIHVHVHVCTCTYILHVAALNDFDKICQFVLNGFEELPFCQHVNSMTAASMTLCCFDGNASASGGL